MKDPLFDLPTVQNPSNKNQENDYVHLLSVENSKKTAKLQTHKYAVVHS